MTALRGLQAVALHRARRSAGLVCSAALLASCGGGGGDSSIGGTSAGLASSASLAQICAVPRPGDSPGTLADEKSFLRSWIDETYLWYRDVRELPAATLDPARYATPVDYFAVLKTPLTTPSGKPKDQFHFTYRTPEWLALAQSGVSFGYGFETALLNAAPPTRPDRKATVAFSEAGTPAAAAGIQRGDEIQTVDGVDLATSSDTAALNAGLFPSAAGAHSFVFKRLDGSMLAVTLSAQAIARTPVQNVRTLPAPNAGVGYLLFNDHVGTSEAQLVAAVSALKAAAVTDLVLDMRYNGGGYLDIASELAYMIAGPSRTGGKFFERLTYNDRNPFGQSASQSTTDFHSVAQGFSLSSGTALPTLNLGRVFVLTSPDTCSASEAVINGLRGAGVTVNTIGGTTCGKPYGFFPRDNCDTTYFAVQFQGVNNLGFGDYADGFAPTCPVADDFTHALGDPAENQLEVALGLRNGGTCTVPVGSRMKAQGAGAEPAAGPVLVRSPLRENRLYRPR